MISPQHVALCAAFWVAIFLFRRANPSRAEAVRFVLGMALGAAFTHFGWALFYFDQVRAHPMALLNPGAGYSVLFFPLGFLATAPWHASRPTRDHYLTAALGALPLAIATARLGCFLGECCGGIPWALGPFDHHPTQLYEVAGFVALHFAVIRSTPRHAPALMLAGFGAIRLIVQPLRAMAHAGPTEFSPMWVAGAWLLVGVFWLWRAEPPLTGTTPAEPTETNEAGSKEWLFAVLVAISFVIPGLPSGCAMLLAGLAGAIALSRRSGWWAVARVLLVCALVGTTLEAHAINKGLFRQAIPDVRAFWVPAGWASLGVVAAAHAKWAWPHSMVRRGLSGGLALLAITLVWNPLGVCTGVFTWPGGGSYVSHLIGFDGSAGIPPWSFSSEFMVGALGAMSIGRGAPKNLNAGYPPLYPVLLAVLLLGALQVNLPDVFPPVLTVAGLAMLFQTRVARLIGTQFDRHKRGVGVAKFGEAQGDV